MAPTTPNFPGLDRGFNSSPFQDQLPRFANALSATPDGVITLAYPASPATFQAYPTIGQIPRILEGRDGCPAGPG
jgi:hypothetical protein